MKRKFFVSAITLAMGLSIFSCSSPKAAEPIDIVIDDDNSDSVVDLSDDNSESLTDEDTFNNDQENEDATSEYESDGFWTADILASEKDKIGTTNEWGLLYTIVQYGRG